MRAKDSEEITGGDKHMKWKNRVARLQGRRDDFDKLMANKTMQATRALQGYRKPGSMNK